MVEVEGKHYVFGPFDIYVHDGTSKQSICDERVKNFIFGALNNADADRCFVQHNPTLNEIYFCYKSGDQHVAFPNADRCNRAAAYNYRNDSWSFMDLPNVSSGNSRKCELSGYLRHQHDHTPSQAVPLLPAGRQFRQTHSNGRRKSVDGRSDKQQAVRD